MGVLIYNTCMLGDGYMNFTGYPSIDNIHNKDYSFFDRNPIIPDMSIIILLICLVLFIEKKKLLIV